MSDAIYFPPLEKGTTVATVVVTANELGDAHAIDVEQLREPHSVMHGCDIVLLSVPAGEGMAVEAAICRALRVESSQS